MARTWLDEHQARQNYSTHVTFTKTLADDNVATVVSLPSNGVHQINKISFVIELNDAYVRFDGTASVGTTSMLIPAGEGYFDDGIYIGTNITIINATAGQNARIRGIAWGMDNN